MNHLRCLTAIASLLILAVCLPLGCQKPPATPTEADEMSGPPWFTEFTSEAGISFIHDAGPVDSYFMPQIVGSGAALFDFNNDGLLDILLLQGGGPQSAAKNQLYQQLPGGKFKDVSAGSGLDFVGFNTGVAIGDVNNDGRPDVLITQYGGVRLFLNNGDGTFTDVTKEAGLINPGWATSAAFFDYDRDGWLDLVVVNYVDYDPSWNCTGPNGVRDYCSPKTFAGTVSKLFHNLGKKLSPPGNGSKTPAVRFEDVSFASGLGKVAGPGLGVVCADFNGDGWPDIFIANDGKPNHLWINQKDGTFKEEAVARGVALNAMGAAEANMGIGFGDIDGDGLPDLFVTHLTSETPTLWKQGPRGAFRDATVFSGLAKPRWRATGFGTVLGDFNQDGALDVAVVNGRVARGVAVDNPELPAFYRPYAERNQLFANDGTGKFRDISHANPAFCGTPRISRGLAMGAIFGDGSLHLLVTEVAGPARVFRNVAPDRGHWLLVRVLDPALHRDAYGAEVTVKTAKRSWVGFVNAAGSFQCSNDPRVHFGLGRVDRIESVDVLWPDGDKETFDKDTLGDGVDRPIVLEKGKGKPTGR
jgi:hypothetical protein